MAGVLYFYGILRKREQVFDEKRNLFPLDDSKLELVGYFESVKDIEEVVVNFKFVIKYVSKEGDKKVIYYKTTK